METKKIVWLSANRFGLELLKEAVVCGIPVAAVITLATDAKTRMYDGVPDEAWDAFAIPVHRIRHIRDEAELLKELNADIVVMAGWRQVIDSALLAIPKEGFVGFHPTLLPHGRGPAPIINSMLEGLTISGVTFFHIDDGVDTGDIIGQETFLIGAQDYAADVYEKVIIAGKTLIRTYLPLLLNGEAPRQKQQEKDATLYPARTLAENELLPSDSWERKCAKVRALSHPYAGAFCMRGTEKTIVWTVEELKHYEQP